jgi:hypothetical protein
MSKGKLILGLIIAALFGVFVFQNQGYFFAKHQLGINLYVVNTLIPETYNAVYFLGFFLTGFIIAYVFGLFAKFKSNQTIKVLKSDLSARANTIARLETENESLKSAVTEKSPKQGDVETETVSETLPVPEENT